jgi:hypothetical protein
MDSPEGEGQQPAPSPTPGGPGAVEPARAQAQRPDGPVNASFLPLSLTPTSTQVTARIEYGPASAPVSVQLELPPGVRVTRGRTFFTLDPTPARATHLEPYTLATDALPVKDLGLVVKAPGGNARAVYGFGRHAPLP